jgi:hypothetical protein
MQNHWWPVQIIGVVGDMESTGGDGSSNTTASIAVMERASLPHSTPDQQWYRHQWHHRIEWRPAVLVTTTTLDHKPSQHWYLIHRRRMVRWTDVVVFVIAAGSSATPVVVHYQLPPYHTLTRWWSNQQHLQIVHNAGGGTRPIVAVS